MPDIGHIAGEQGPGLSPIAAVVVRDLATRKVAADTEACPLAPCRLVAHAIRRIGHHKMWLDAVEHAVDGSSIGAVAADEPMGAEEPEVAIAAHGLQRNVRYGIGIGEAAPAGSQKTCDLLID